MYVRKSGMMDSFPMVFLKDLRLESLGFGCFITAILVYAFFGSPTPDQPGIIEGLIAGFLIVGIAPSAFQAMRFITATHILFYYGLIVPLIIGAAAGNPAIAMARDMAGFLFLMLPLLASPLIENEAREKKLIRAFVFLGLVFSARAILDTTMMVPQSLTYFANTAGVLFACVFLMGYAAREENIVFALLCGVFALVPVIAMSLTLQRASLGFVLIAAACFLFMFVKNRKFGFIVPIIFMIAGVILWPQISWLYESLSQKTILFGSNRRIEEIAAVWDAVSDSGLEILFGKGWGGSFESPAVASIRVNYTHNLLSAMMLKTGLAGMMMTAVYLFMMARKIMVIFAKDFRLALALTGPFLIGTFLYASYKSFDYGILLLLIVVGASRQWIASQRQEV